MLSRLNELLNAAQVSGSIVRDATKITFPVDDVTAVCSPPWEITLKQCLEHRTGSTTVVMPDQDAPTVLVGGYHALIEAVHLAFSQHRPLVLSPDSIWLTIVQGFGHHVHENAKALRDRIVRHDGKMRLHVEVTSLDTDQIPGLVSQFSSLIHDNSDPVLYETLMCDFSTTTPTIRTASEVALMDVYERYFEYSVTCICGIPSITLRGTPADWQRMRERVEVLATYDLDWWISRLIPILDQFVATAEGRPDRRFWQSIYKPKATYGSHLATGWITDLFPYLGDPPKRTKNMILKKRRLDWILTSSKIPDFLPSGISPKEFPGGLSRAPLMVKSADGSEASLDIMGGFFGVGFDPEEAALFPIISWALTEKPAAPVRDTPKSNFHWSQQPVKASRPFEG